MKRRSFLGFAIGGAVAAPAAVLVGERVIDRANGYVVGEIGPEVTNLPKPITIEVIGSAQGDEHVRRLIQQAMNEQVRGGFSYHNRKSGPCEFLNPVRG